jgi:hypothetical protein
VVSATDPHGRILDFLDRMQFKDIVKRIMDLDFAFLGYGNVWIQTFRSILLYPSSECKITPTATSRFYLLFN